MRLAKPLPETWLVSDARNDAMLESALTRLPRGSGFIYRHYHLGESERFERFRALGAIAQTRGHVTVLADSAITAREWGAQGIYGPPRALAPRRRDLLHLASVHDLREIALANRLGADAVLLSPVFPTRSHPGEGSLRPALFRLLARRSRMPVIALGGMDEQRAGALRWKRWAAIDAFA